MAEEKPERKPGLFPPANIVVANMNGACFVRSLQEHHSSIGE